MKEEKNYRSKWLHLRLTVAEQDRLQREFQQVTDRKLSDFARKKLLGKPFTVLTRDQSRDKLIEELAGLRSELSKAAVNYNQAVKKLHTLGRIKEFEHWIVTYEIDRRKLLSEAEKVSVACLKLVEKW